MIANEKVLEEFYVRIYEIDPYFHKNYKEKIIKFVKNGHEYMPFRINVYFSEYDFSVEVNEKKKNTDRDLIFEDKKHQKKLDCKFIRTNPNKKNYDEFYEIGRIFLREFKNKKLKELEETIKKLKQKINF